MSPEEQSNRTKQLVDKISKSQNYEELEEHWQGFLSSFVRTRNKIMNKYKSCRNWGKWNKKYANEIKYDPLLSYILIARNSAEHTIESSTEEISSSVGISPAAGNVLEIEEMTIGQNGSIETFKSKQPAVFSFKPGRMGLLPIESKGRTYNPPISHLGESIDETDIVSIAQRGYEYMDNYLKEASGTFNETK